MSRQRLIDEVDGLRRAMESRAVIEQAKGVVMATCGCDAQAAFEILVAQSQHENRKVRSIAADLVEQQQRRSALQRPVGPADRVERRRG